jgi:Transposase DDE domain
MENRNGLVVRARLTQATGSAERDTAVEMLADLDGNQQVRVEVDKGYDARIFVDAARMLNVTPCVAQNTTNRRGAIDRRTVRHAGYALSQRYRKRVEEIFGWMKTVGPMRQTQYRGTWRVGWMFTLTAAAYNLVRIRNLCEAT